MEINKVSRIPTRQEKEHHTKEHGFDAEKSFDYDQITSEIFLGTNMCCQMGYEEELLFKDIRADISLEGERVDNPKGVDYFLWLPVEDKHAPTEHQLELGVANLNYFVAKGLKVYVHCKHGHGRAPTLVAGFLISKGAGVQEAIDEISKHRPSIHLEDEQIAALQRYAEKGPYHDFL